MKRGEYVQKITKTMLDEKVAYIERQGKVKLRLQGSNHRGTYHYQLVETCHDGSEHNVNNGMFNMTEMYYYLIGIIDGIDCFATWGT